MSVTTDVIDHLLGTEPGSPLDHIRAARPDARENAQRSYEALFAPVDATEISLPERLAVAAFVTGLHRVAPVAQHYAATLRDLDPAVAEVIDGEVVRGLGAGPYGTYREPGLAGESRPGPIYTAGNRAALGERLAGALEHAHLLVFRPREAGPEALDRLLAAGWSATGIVTLSQLIAFLSFQVRVVHGLGELARTTTATPATDRTEELQR
ncbi:CMD domain protein [Georgenia yuyongxinii]|uniref:CMD domain protein n=1 Tax=Georgenia yuyongxinii TaxID=2589797 RepID=A0A552WU32_9MICO|nr:CMD domain protein [Georgenia yuyongxinii]TRW46292.1 CMD domain protein [Georgenia yuyongxinii]